MDGAFVDRRGAGQADGLAAGSESLSQLGDSSAAKTARMRDSDSVRFSDGEAVTIHHYMPTPSESRIPLPPIQSSFSQSTQRTAAYGEEQQQPAASSIEARVTKEVKGMSKPALLGYTTGLLIFLFGCLGTMFNDDLDFGGIKKTIASSYLFAAVTLVQISSIADNTWRSSQRK